ncbi:MAG: tetratricopeptide repeat protein [Gammaproteobacteria bacterium]|nr:tetratricopeptide repeat protein [Gammaproteobacteria bacterium]
MPLVSGTITSMLHASNDLFKAFWADLKRRHVVRISIAYLGIGWGLLETTEFVLGILETPDWIFRAAVSAVALGFPITVILVWVFDISGRHVVRTESSGFHMPRWAKIVLGTPMILVVLASGFWVWDGYVEEKQRSLRPTDLGDEVPIIAVLPIRNLTGNPDLDWFGEGIVSLVRDNLSRSRFLRIASPQKWATIVGTATEETEIASLAAEQDIGFIVAGEMLMTPDGIYVSSRLSDTAGGVVLSARQVENLKPETILEAASPIATQIRKGLGVPREEQVDVFAADFAIDNQEAYEHYVSGLGHFLNYRYEEARQEFEAALAVAPDFGVARYRLAYIQAVFSETATALENMRIALQDPFLLDRERRYIEAALSLFGREYTEAIAAYESLLEDYPYEVEARELLAQALWGSYRVEEAVSLMEQLVLEEPQNEVIWSALGYYLLEMQSFEKAGEALSRFAELAPENPNSYTLLGDALRLQGDLDGAITQYRHALEIDPYMPTVKHSMATIALLKGKRDDAMVQFQALVDDDTLMPRERLDAGFALSSLLESQGDFDTAVDLLVRFNSMIREEQVWLAMSTASMARLRMELGEPETASLLAAQAIEQSPGVPTRYLFTRALLELHAGEFEKVSQTTAEIRSYALPPDDPDRTEDKAAAYLDGMALLKSGSLADAESLLRDAVEVQGHAYAIYELGLAIWLSQQGEHDAALQLISSATVSRPSDPRIDLEPDRTRALLRKAEVEMAVGDKQAAMASAKDFLERFRQAPAEHPDSIRARNIIEVKNEPSD